MIDFDTYYRRTYVYNPARGFDRPVISEPNEMLVFRQNLNVEGGLLMGKKRFSVEQMIGVLKQAQAGVWH
jgi:hypothetical protein